MSSNAKCYIEVANQANYAFSNVLDGDLVITMTGNEAGLHAGYTSPTSNVLLSVTKEQVRFGGDNSNISFSNNIINATTLQQGGTALSSVYASLATSNQAYASNLPKSGGTLTGNISIDTSSASAVSMTVRNSSSASTSYGSINFINDLGLSGIIFQNSSTRTSDGPANSLTLRNDRGAVRVSGSNADGIYVNGNGRVGISTTNPISPLHVFQGTANNSIASFVGNGGGNNVYSIDLASYLNASNVPTSRLNIIDDALFSSSLAFLTKVPGADFNSLSERMRITSDGKVGVGTSNPTQALDVNGNMILGTQSAPGYISAGNLGMFRNRIINGDMRIDQRNDGASVALGNGVFPTDRFQFAISATSGAGTSSIIALSSSDPPAQAGFSRAIRASITTGYNLGASGWFALKQRVEAINISDFGWHGNASGSTVIASFWFRANATGNYSFVLRNDRSSVQSYVTSFNVATSGTWSYYTIMIPPPSGSGAKWNVNDTGVGLDIHITSLNPVSTTATVGWSTPGTSPEQLSSGIVNWIGTAGNYIEVTGVQLEKGTIATPFEFRPLSIEERLCYRYYKHLGTGGAIRAFFCTAYAFNTTTGIAFFPIEAPMRSTPTVVTSNNLRFVTPSASPTITSLVFLPTETSSTSICIQFSSASLPLSTGYISANGDATSFLAVSAEL